MLLTDIHVALVRLLVDNLQDQEKDYEGFLGLILSYDDLKNALPQIWPEVMIKMRDFADDIFDLN